MSSSDNSRFSYNGEISLRKQKAVVGSTVYLWLRKQDVNRLDVKGILVEITRASNASALCPDMLQSSPLG